MTEVAPSGALERQNLLPLSPPGTERDLEILRKVTAAGWLTSRQIRDYFFPGKSTNAVCKRLRKLAAAGYLAIARRGATELGLYRLAVRGKFEIMERTDCDERDINISTQLPGKIEHFVAVNDLRFYFERMIEGTDVECLYFFSERELAKYAKRDETLSDPILTLLRSYRIIPDAIARIRITRDGTSRCLDLFIEYDAGTENAAFFGNTKVRQYSSLVTQRYELLENIKVLTFARSIRRIVSLMKQVARCRPPHNLFYFALVEKLNRRWWAAAEVFLDPYDYFFPVKRGNLVEAIEKKIDRGAVPGHALVRLPAVSPHNVSLRGEHL